MKYFILLPHKCELEFLQNTDHIRMSIKYAEIRKEYHTNVHERKMRNTEAICFLHIGQESCRLSSNLPQAIHVHM